MHDSTQDNPNTLDKLATGWRKRGFVTAKSMGRLGANAAKRALLGGQGKPLDPDKAMKDAEQLLSDLDGLKGLAMKVGQMASYLDTTMPPAAQKVLAKLQSQSSPMSVETIVPAVERELEGTLDDRFESFETVPFAAASIGQVHRARVGAQTVAVKVQYPGIRELLASDLKSISRVSKLASLFSPVDGPALVEELRLRMMEECDYRVEAEHQETFRRLFTNREGYRVPQVITSHSTEKVLTTELVEDALGFYDFIETASAEARRAAAERIFSFSFLSIFQHQMYNADPHPGNYLFDAEGGVTFLDFGCVKRFDDEQIDLWRRMAGSILQGRKADFISAFLEAGLIKNSKKVDFDVQWAAAQVLYRPMLASDRFAFTPEYLDELNRALFYDNVNKRYLDLPPQWLFVNRLQWGLYALLSHLNVDADFATPFRAAVGVEAIH